MPRSAVHAEQAVVTAQNDAVVAENLCPGMLKPKTGSGAFAGAGMPDEKAANTIFGQHAASVDFDAFAHREAMNHEEFVERIFERINRKFRIEIALEQGNATVRKVAIELRFLVGRQSQICCLEIKGKAA